MYRERVQLFILHSLINTVLKEENKIEKLFYKLRQKETCHKKKNSKRWGLLFFRRSFCKYNKKYCRELLTVRTGNEAVEICRNNPDIDLILMDIMMPEMDGYEATREIRKFNQNVYIIAQTAFALSGDRDRSIEAGCDEYISKPINNGVLKALIEDHFLNRDHSDI